MAPGGSIYAQISEVSWCFLELAKSTSVEKIQLKAETKKKREYIA